MEQRCHLSMIWLTWLGLPALAIVVGVFYGWTAGLGVALAGVLAQMLYLRMFPWLSRALGYGSVVDTPADSPPPPTAVGQVMLYTANVCPFCPIIKKRLEKLQNELGFDLVKVDVTFRPRLITAKGLSSVPVVEANGEFIVGNATTAQLATFLSRSASEKVTTASSR